MDYSSQQFIRRSCYLHRGLKTKGGEEIFQKALLLV